MTEAETQFACEYCGQAILVDSDAAGHSTLCPACGRVVTVPSSSGGSKDARDFQRPPGVEYPGAAQRPAAAAAHQQAEFRSFHHERLTMRSDVAQLRQVLLERERQLGQWQAALERLGTERLVLEHDLESTRRQLAGLQEGLANRRDTLAGAHRKLARERAVTQELRDEMGALRERIGELTAKLTLATGAREALVHTAERLQQAHEKGKRLELEITRLEQAGAQRDQEIRTLRRDLTRTDTGKQVLELRAQLEEALEEDAHLRTRVEELDGLLQNRARQYKRLEEVLAETSAHFGEALRKAESVSDERLKQDNKILVGIIARQNVDMELRHRELHRLKRARFWLRAIYGLIILALVALAIVASQFVPNAVFENWPAWFAEQASPS